MDGNLIDRSNYTAKEGSTIITLKASYLNTLSAGTHTVEILWTDGSASTTFTIKANTSDPTDEARSGLYHDGSEWNYYKEGIKDTTYTGLCKYNGSWWYVKNGKVDFSATTLCKYNGAWFYVKGGKVDFPQHSVNTMVHGSM